MQKQVQFRLLSEIKTCKSSCYGLQGPQMTWCTCCISEVTSKDLPWYSRQAQCKSCSVYATPEPKDRWKEKFSLLDTCALDRPYVAWHWSDNTTEQPSSLKQPLGQTALIWMCFSWDQTRVGALNLGQPSWETQTFSLLIRSRLMQQSEGMVTLALPPLLLPWDLSGNHAKELIQATNNIGQ